MTVHNIETPDGFKETLAKNPVVLVDFFATWCGPCKAIAPQVADWSNKYTNIHYVKVDVDALPSLTQEYGVTAMPTFMVFKDGEKVDSLRGAMPQALLKIIENHNPAEAPKTEE